MEYITTLPPDLQSKIGTENIDFAVKAKRRYPRIQTLKGMGVGVIGILFIVIFISVFGQTMLNFDENGISLPESNPHGGAMDTFFNYIPFIIFACFVFIGASTLLSSFSHLFLNGGYFVGTEKRLINYRRGKLKTYEWKQFSGNMEFNRRQDEITLELRTGKSIRRFTPNAFEPDVVYISGVPNILEVERICRKRIKENDPTPPPML